MAGHSLWVVEVLRFLAILAGFLALLTLPCWLVFIISADVAVERVGRALARRGRGRREGAGRSLGGGGRGWPAPPPAAPGAPPPPPRPARDTRGPAGAPPRPRR